MEKVTCGARSGGMMTSFRQTKREQERYQEFYSKDKLPEKKKRTGNIKYIYVLAFDGYVRPHFHILMTGDGMDRDELESLWKNATDQTHEEYHLMMIFSSQV